MTDLRYPVGKFEFDSDVTDAKRMQWIADITELPGKLRSAVGGLDDKQLDTPYRPEGWTVRQVVHHVADSHMNAFIRLKLALTEDEPTIKPYNEAEWAKHSDMNMPIDVSLQIIDSVHARWVNVLGSLGPEDFARTLRHPEFEKPFNVEALTSLYSWHSRHHTAHVTNLRARLGW